MQPIPIPSKMEFQEGKAPNHGNVIIEPCYPGYGITLGNALRRVLLSSLSGGAVTAFKIKGVLHEFSSIENVKEDVVEISLNLKKVRLKVFSDQPVRITLKSKGDKKVTAGDIEKNSNVEVINPDLHIATMTDKSAEFEMELVVSQGRGYSPTESRQEELEVGMIAIDSIYSPVTRVNFTVENVRVGQMTNWDRLILDIETDGSITPREALNKVSSYLIDHFTFIKLSSDSDSAEAPKKVVTEETAEMPEKNEIEDEKKKPVPEKKTEKKRGRPKKQPTPENE